MKSCRVNILISLVLLLSLALPSYASSNLIQNGGFESGQRDPWDWGFPTTDAHTGNFAIYGDWTSQTVRAVVPGMAYDLSAVGKMAPGASANGRVMFHWYDASDTWLAQHEFVLPAGTTTYTNYSHNFTAPAGTAYVHVYAQASAGDNFIVDDIAIHPNAAHAGSASLNTQVDTGSGYGLTDTVDAGVAFTYRLTYGFPSGPTYSEATLVCPLPPEVRYLSKGNSPHIQSSTYDSESHSVIFTFNASLPTTGFFGECLVETRFPSDAETGDSALMCGTLTYHEDGVVKSRTSSPATQVTATNGVAPMVLSNGVSVDLWEGEGLVHIDGGQYYGVSHGSLGGTPLDSYVIEVSFGKEFIFEYFNHRDAFPGVVTFTARYQTNQNATWRDWPGGSIEVHDDTQRHASELSLNTDEYVTAMQLDFDSGMPAGENYHRDHGAWFWFVGDVTTQYTKGVANDREGTPVSAGHTSTVMATLNATAGATPYSDSDFLISTIDAAQTTADFEMRYQTQGPYTPGQTVSVRMVAQSPPPNINPLVNPTMVTLLPEQLVYAGNVEISDNQSGALAPPMPNVTTTPNWKGSGRTLLKFVWDSSTPLTIIPNTQWVEANIDFDLQVSSTASTGTYQQRVFGWLESPTAFACQWDRGLVDTFDEDDDGNVTEELCGHELTFEIFADGLGSGGELGVLCSDIGPLMRYNVITFEDLHTNSDIEGKTFVGGNLTGTDTSLFALQESATTCGEDTLIVAGDIIGGDPLSVSFGGVRLGGTDNGRVINLLGACSLTNDPSVSVGSIEAQLKNASSMMTGMSTNSGATIPTTAGPVTFLGAAASGEVAVFHVSAADVFSNVNATAIEMNLNGAAAAVINVSGTAIDWNNGADMTAGFTNLNVRDLVIWNFYEATSINLQSKNLLGNALAPFADISTGGPIDGSIAAKSLTTTADVHVPTLDLTFPCLEGLCTDTFAYLNNDLTGPSIPLDLPVGASLEWTAAAFEPALSITADVTFTHTAGSNTQRIENVDFHPGSSFAIVTHPLYLDLTGITSTDPAETYRVLTNGGVTTTEICFSEPLQEVELHLFDIDDKGLVVTGDVVTFEALDANGNAIPNDHWTLVMSGDLSPGTTGDGVTPASDQSAPDVTFGSGSSVTLTATAESGNRDFVVFRYRGNQSVSCIRIVGDGTDAHSTSHYYFSIRTVDCDATVGAGAGTYFVREDDNTIYSVDLTNGDTAAVGSTTNTWNMNALALDPSHGASGTLWYTDQSSHNLYKFDVATGTELNLIGNLGSGWTHPVSSSVLAGAWYDDAYYIATSWTDDLYKVTFNATKNAIADVVKVADMQGNTALHSWGDFTITTNGILYGVQAETVFSYDLHTNGPIAPIASATGLTALTFDAAGNLLGIDETTTTIPLFTINATTGDVSPWTNTTLGASPGDLAGMPATHVDNNAQNATIYIRENGSDVVVSGVGMIETAHYAPGSPLHVKPDGTWLEPNVPQLADLVSGNYLGFQVTDPGPWGSGGLSPGPSSATQSGFQVHQGEFYLLDGTPSIDLSTISQTYSGQTLNSLGLNEGVYTYQSTTTTESFDVVVELSPSTMTLGNLVFMDTNANGLYDSGDSGINGVAVELWSAGDDPNGGGSPVATVITSGGGFYTFTGLSAGDYFVHIPAEEFQSGGNLLGHVSTPGAGGNQGAPDWNIADDLDDDTNENGIDSHHPATTGISSASIRLAVGDEPSNSGSETGQGTLSDDAIDANGNLTVDFGFTLPSPATLCGDLLYLCGSAKGSNADAYDHGVIGYLVWKGYTITPAIITGTGLQDPMTGAAITKPLEAFQGIIASGTAHGELPGDLGGVTTALKATTTPILYMEGLSVEEMGIASGHVVNFSDNTVWIEDNTSPLLPTGLANGSVTLMNPPVAGAGPTGASKVFVFANGAGSGGEVEIYDVDQPGANAYFLYGIYEAGDTLADSSVAAGRRVYYGITENGAGYYLPQINLNDPTNFLTAEGKALFDQALEASFLDGCTSDPGTAYFIHQHTNTLYTINLDTGDPTVLANTTATGRMNGLAFDEANDHLWYIDDVSYELYQFDLSTNTEIGVIGDLSDSGWTSPITAGLADAAAWYDGAMYVGTDSTDDLYRVTFNVDFTAVTDVIKVADINGDASPVAWGDFGISTNGILYGADAISGTVFRYDILGGGPRQNITSGAPVNGVQIGGDGRLYGIQSVVADSPLYTVDLTTSAVSSHVNTGLPTSPGDLAGPVFPEPFGVPVTVSVQEHAAGELDGFANVTVSLSAFSSAPVSVDYATFNDSALAGSDYTHTAGTVTIPAGSTSATIAIPILSDSIIEPLEFFQVQVSNPIGATIATAQANISISDCAADIIFLLDQSGSISGTEWSNMVTSIHGIIDRVKAESPASRIAITEYAGTSNFPPIPQVWIEGDFTEDRDVAKASITWRRGSTSVPNTLHTGDDAHGAVGLIGKALDGLSDSQILSPEKTLTRQSGRPLILFLFTDATRGHNSSWLVNSASPGVGTAGAFANYTDFKNNRGAKFVSVIVPTNPAGPPVAAAIASAGGTYVGAVEPNPADPDGSASTPRFMTTSPVFDLTVAQLDEIAQNICLAGGPQLLPVADYGDYSALPSASSNVTSNLRIGAQIDAELGATPDGAAIGDDLRGTDDEDGITFSDFTPGQSASATAMVTNDTGATVYLNAWADWNEDGDLNDSNEHLTATEISVSSSAVQNRPFTFPFTVPATAKGTIPIRVRLTSTSSPGPDGADGSGEVEDYLVTITTTCSSQLSIYNAIISNDLSTPSDIRGRSVVHNIIGSDSFSTGHAVTGAGTITMAVENGVEAGGGSINVVNGSLWAPSSGALNGRTVNFSGGGALVTSPAFDFSSVFDGILNESAIYASMPANSTVTIPTSPAVTYLTVGSGVADGAPAVFQLDGNSLLHNGNVQTIDLDLNGTNPSAIIINLSGSAINYDWSGENINLLRDVGLRPKILWHFPEATSVNLHRPLYGSILAPHATFQAHGGANEGSIMVKDYIGNIAVKLPLWEGGSTLCTDASDYGDSQLFPDASSSVSGNLHLGSAIGDIDSSPVVNASATGDDLSGTDDEDGLISASLTEGSSGSIVINRVNSSGAPAYLNAWIDWDGDGILGETNGGVSDHVIANVMIADGVGGNASYPVNVPTIAAAGSVHMRIRLTSTNNPGPTNYSGYGEVEDHAVTINASIKTLAVSDQSVSESAPHATIAVNLSAASTSPVSVDYTTSNGTALAGSDYTLTNGTLTIPSGATTGTITVPLLEDNLSEGPESFTIVLNNPTGATISDGNATITISDNDNALLAIADSSANEGAGSVDVMVNLSNPAASDVHVDFTTNDGTAMAGSDYTALSGTVTFPAGSTSESVTISLLDDALLEGDEVFSVNLSNPTNASLGTASADVTITENDTLELSVADLAANEGSGTADVVLLLSNASASDITVDYATSDGTAVASQDYTSATGTLTIPAGDTSLTIPITILDDGNFERNEDFVVDFSNSSQGSFTKAQAIVTILDNECDETPYLIQNASADLYGVDFENANTNLLQANIAAYRINGIGYNRADHYLWGFKQVSPWNTVVRINPDYSVDEFVIPGLNADGYHIGDVDANGVLHLGKAFDTQVIRVDLNPRSPNYLAVLPDLTLSDSDSWGDWAFHAIDGKLYTIDRTEELFRIDPSTGLVTKLAKLKGIRGSGYFGASYCDGLGSFYALREENGIIYRIANVHLLTGATEPDVEFFSKAPSGWTSDGARCALAAPPTGPLRVNVADAIVSEGDSTAIVDISLTTTHATPVSVDYEAFNNTAQDGFDYVATSGTVTIPAGSTSVSVSISLIEDDLPEGQESFFVVASNPTGGAILADDAGIVSITDDDAKDTDRDGAPDIDDIDDDDDGILDVDEAFATGSCGADVEVILLLDNSGSISASEWDSFSAFTRDVIDELGSFGSVKMAVAHYWSDWDATNAYLYLESDFTTDPIAAKTFERRGIGQDELHRTAQLLRNALSGSGTGVSGATSTLSHTPGAETHLLFMTDAAKALFGDSNLVDPNTPGDPFKFMNDLKKDFNMTVTSVRFNTGWAPSDAEANAAAAALASTGGIYTGAIDENLTDPEGSQTIPRRFYNVANFGGIPSTLAAEITHLTCEVTADFDGDGYPDHLDIDSDNDGIPDNVEAQSTAAYVEPNGDAGPVNNGLDSAYLGGLNPVDSDQDGQTDVYDADSDNDGDPDINENGWNVHTISMIDDDGDGLDDEFDTELILWDVNDRIFDPNPATLGDLDGDLLPNGDNATPMLRDVDFRDPGKQDGYGIWKNLYTLSLGSESDPKDNPDNDLYDNLLEYALCLHPGTGLPGPGGFFVETDGTQITAKFYRPKGGLGDVTYIVDARADLPILDSDTWSSILTIPGDGSGSGVTVTDLGNAIEEVRVTNLENFAPLSLSSGFIRLSVQLNSQTSYTPVWGWTETEIELGHTESYANPFNKPEVLSGTIDAVVGTHQLNVLTATGGVPLEAELSTLLRSYYIEIIDGDLAGHRFDIAAVKDHLITIATDTDLYSGPPYNTRITASEVPSTLAGAPFVLREHQTLDDLFPPMSGAFTPQAHTFVVGHPADRIHVYAADWDSYWLYDNNAGNHNAYWALDGDSTISNRGKTVIPPDQGLFVAPQETTVTFLALGIVRKNAFAMPLRHGWSLQASPFPISQGPAERNMNHTTFYGSDDPATSDTVCFWLGDSDTAAYQASFRCAFLFVPQDLKTPRWLYADDEFLAPRDFETTIFPKDRSSFYYRHLNPKPDYIVPLPWCINLIGE